MKEIGFISSSRLNNGAHFLFMTNIALRADNDTRLKAKMSSLINALKDALAQEDKNLKISQKSLLTDELVATDELRDKIYSGYKKSVDGYRDFPLPEIATAAKELWQHLKDYAIDPKTQLDKETGLLINLISDLEGKFAPQVTKLSLTPFVTQLKAANERVRQLATSRTNEKMGSVVGALRIARKATDEAYLRLVKTVNAHAIVEGESDYAPFIDYVNLEITHYKREAIGQKAAMPETSIAPDSGPESERPDEI